MTYALAGKTAVVTGASSGIGRAIALEFAAAGADVTVHCRANVAAAEGVAAEIRRLGRIARVLAFDISQTDKHDNFVGDVWSQHDRVDIWVNNAGADVLTTPAAKLPFQQRLDLLWKTDVAGTIGLSRLAGERMAGQPPADCLPVILNMGWDQAESGMAGESGELFGAVKGAVMAFTRSLARTLAPRVRVNCLAPGWIKTQWGESASVYWQQRAIAESLLARWGTPEDVARVACFVASPAASFLTGQIIPINGGLRQSE